MHSARVSIGNTSLAVRYAELAPAEAKKKMIAPEERQRRRGQVTEHEAGDAEQHARDHVGER